MCSSLRRLLNCPAVARILLAFVGILVVSSWWPPATLAQDQTKAFARKYSEQVRPLLKKHCVRCHGEAKQEADLRLDFAGLQALKTSDSYLLDHSSGESLLVGRLYDSEHGDLMPLDAQPLRVQEVEKLRKWISEGAILPRPSAEESSQHWAYRTLNRPTVPKLLPRPSSAIYQAPVNAIDCFVESTLESHGMKPKAEEEQSSLLRRLSLALTGVPPSPTELEAFHSSPPEIAYELAVNRLLASPRFGEKWSIPWLDMARYADSNGFQADQLRENWAYRDWVIRAFNRDTAYDEFVIDQLAGDLRPNPTLEQRIATGFHRMTTCNVEAGVDPESNRIDQIVDRVNTTATAFMGTTLECAQCHDHKYDPFTQADYYRMFAYFNNTPLEVDFTSGVTYEVGGPNVELPLPQELMLKRRDLENSIHSVKNKLSKVRSAEAPAFLSWLEKIRSMPTEEKRWQIATSTKFSEDGGADYEQLDDGSILLTGSVPDKTTYEIELQIPPGTIRGLRIEALTDERLPGKGPGRGDSTKTNFILSEVECELVSPYKSEAIALTHPQADFSQKNWPIANAIDGDEKTGWAIAPQFGKPHWASFSFAKPVEKADSQAFLRVKLKQFYGRGRVIGKLRVALTEIAAEYLTVDEATAKLAKKKKRTDAQNEKLLKQFALINADVSALEKQVASLEKELASIEINTTPVMVEMEQPRQTFVLARGNYDSPLDEVHASPPAILSRENSQDNGSRMELAQWLTSEENPLLPRTTVNRIWLELFGTGLVNTPEDLGTQSEDPSHPELLEWLAAEFVESGWSTKHIVKTIVLSRTFRQSAAADRETLETDPQNRLLSRGPRFRLPAEAIRDSSLEISGLMCSTMYGSPVMPYQPDKVWRSVGRNQPKWETAEDESRFRRGIYIICKRAAPYPSFITFDATDRASCTVQRAKSNTPLQALTLLNDPAYAEMSLAFADRILCECATASDESRIEYAFRLAVSRSPSSLETTILQNLLDQERKQLNKETIEARCKPPFTDFVIRHADRAELAAWYSVANAILNLDETQNQ